MEKYYIKHLILIRDCKDLGIEQDTNFLKDWPASKCEWKGVTSEAGTANPTGAPEFTPVCVAGSLVFCIVFCRSYYIKHLILIRDCKDLSYDRMFLNT
jgi:hypothetical protein